MSLRARFVSKCGKPNANGCIPWLGTKTLGGYGTIRISHDYGRASYRTTAHRAAWILENGYVPRGMSILHSCDNPSCVNLEHLFAGSPRENTHDMIAKNRHGWRNGAPWQKLNATDGERIRDLRRAGCIQQTIADWMDVSRPLISMILGGKIQHSVLEEQRS